MSIASNAPHSPALAVEVDPDQDWLFRVNCLGPFASDEDIAQAINDAPDPDHPEVAYLRTTLEARFISAKAA